MLFSKVLPPILFPMHTPHTPTHTHTHLYTYTHTHTHTRTHSHTHTLTHTHTYTHSPADLFTNQTPCMKRMNSGTWLMKGEDVIENGEPLMTYAKYNLKELAVSVHISLVLTNTHAFLLVKAVQTILPLYS